MSMGDRILRGRKSHRADELPKPRATETKKPRRREIAQAVATGVGEVCNFGFACKHGSGCRGRHADRERILFRQREREVAALERGSGCAYCKAGVCKYGAQCRGQTAMRGSRKGVVRVLKIPAPRKEVRRRGRKRPRGKPHRDTRGTRGSHQGSHQGSQGILWQVIAGLEMELELQQEEYKTQLQVKEAKFHDMFARKSQAHREVCFAKVEQVRKLTREADGWEAEVEVLKARLKRLWEDKEEEEGKLLEEIEEIDRQLLSGKAINEGLLKELEELKAQSGTTHFKEMQHSSQLTEMQVTGGEGAARAHTEGTRQQAGSEEQQAPAHTHNQDQQHDKEGQKRKDRDNVGEESDEGWDYGSSDQGSDQDSDSYSSSDLDSRRCCADLQMMAHVPETLGEMLRQRQCKLTCEQESIVLFQGFWFCKDHMPRPEPQRHNPDPDNPWECSSEECGQPGYATHSGLWFCKDHALLERVDRRSMPQEAMDWIWGQLALLGTDWDTIDEITGGIRRVLSGIVILLWWLGAHWGWGATLLAGAGWTKMQRNLQERKHRLQGEQRYKPQEEQRRVHQVEEREELRAYKTHASQELAWMRGDY